MTPVGSCRGMPCSLVGARGATVGLGMSPSHHSPFLGFGTVELFPFWDKALGLLILGDRQLAAMLGQRGRRGGLGSCCSQARGRPFPVTPGRTAVPWLRAAPGERPPLAGSLRPGSAKADSSAGGATIPGPPLASIAVPSCSR